MRRLTLTLLILLLALTLALGAIVGTERGLRWTFDALAGALPGELTVERLNGRLLGPLEAKGLVYRTDDLEVRIDAAHLNWAPRALLRARVRVTQLELRSVSITLPPAQPAAEPTVLPDVTLPLPISVDDARLDGLEIIRPDAAPIVIDNARLAAHTRALTVEIERFEIETPRGALAVNGQIRPRGDYPLELSTRWRVHTSDYPTVRGHGRLDGDLDELIVHQSVTAPAPVEVEGTLHALLGEAPRWHATTRIGPLDPSELNPDWPDARIEASAQGQGGFTTFDLEGRARITSAASGELALDFELERQPTRWRIAGLELQRPASQSSMRVAGTIDDGGPISLEGQWRNLRWPIDDEAQVRSADGTFEIEGTPRAYRLHVAGALAAPQAPPARFDAAAEGDDEQLRIETLKLATLDGHINLQGQLAWRPTLQWQAQVKGRGIDPGEQWPDWPGDLAFDADVHGRRSDQGLVLAVDLASLDGSLRQHDVSGRGRMRMDGNDLAVEDLVVSVAEARLDAQASVNDRLSARWTLEVPDLSALAPAAGGRIASSGRVSGTRSSPRIEARIDAGDVRYGRYTVGQLDGEADIRLQRDAAGRVEVRAEGITLAGYPVSTVTLQGHGRTAAHTFTLAANDPSGLALDIRIEGGLADASWRGGIVAGRFVTPEYGEWELSGDARLARARMELDGLCARQGDRHLCVTGRTRSGEWDAHAEAERLPLDLAARWLPPSLGVRGQLDATAEAHGGTGVAPRAELRLESRQGELRVIPPKGTPAVFAYRLLTMHAALRAQALTAELSADLDEGGSVQGELKLPEPLAPGPFSSKPLHARLHAELTSLAWLGGLMREIEVQSGSARVDLTVDGRLDAPRVQGRAAIEDAVLEIPTAGISLREVRLSAQTRDGADLALRGRARAGEGMVSLEGQARLSAAQGWPVELRIEGERLLAMDTPQARVLVSPELTVQYTVTSLHVEGTVRVPEALMRARAGPGAVRPADDVEVVGDPAREARQSAWTTTADIRVQLGEDVRVEGSGFEGQIKGGLRIREPARGITTAQGELVIVDGRYEAYGQKLKIESGHLRYAGGPIDNPSLDLRAIREVNDVTAGVRVQGTLDDPRLTLFSEPPMDEANILSYLLLGRPMSEARGGDGQMLYNAASSLGFTGGELLAQRIGQQFGIEEVTIESEGPTEEASLVLGKHLSPRLYVNYSVGLFEPVNVFRIRYELGRHWTIQTEGGTHSGADLIYTIEWGGTE